MRNTEMKKRKRSLKKLDSLEMAKHVTFLNELQKVIGNKTAVIRIKGIADKYDVSHYSIKKYMKAGYFEIIEGTRNTYKFNLAKIEPIHVKSAMEIDLAEEKRKEKISENFDDKGEYKEPSPVLEFPKEEKMPPLLEFDKTNEVYCVKCEKYESCENAVRSIKKSINCDEYVEFITPSPELNKTPKFKLDEKSQIDIDFGEFMQTVLSEIHKANDELEEITKTNDDFIKSINIKINDLEKRVAIESENTIILNQRILEVDEKRKNYWKLIDKALLKIKETKKVGLIRLVWRLLW